MKSIKTKNRKQSKPIIKKKQLLQNKNKSSKRHKSTMNFLSFLYSQTSSKIVNILIFNFFLGEKTFTTRIMLGLKSFERINRSVSYFLYFVLFWYVRFAWLDRIASGWSLYKLQIGIYQLEKKRNFLLDKLDFFFKKKKSLNETLKLKDSWKTVQE